jgi:predicted metal-dependent hydrolase
MNAMSLLFPAGELWFCRVYNRATPVITDSKLRADANGFMRQEALHSRSHNTVIQYFSDELKIDVSGFLKITDFIFKMMLDKRPLGLPFGGESRFWLRQQLGIISALEHFFSYAGQWAIEAKALDDAKADPIMLDLLRWHGAEEVEHRRVAFDIYKHLGGGYFQRCFLMVVTVPILLFMLMSGCRYMFKKDTAPGKPRSVILGWMASAKHNRLPGLWTSIKHCAVYFKPSFDPGSIGDLQVAMDYFAKSPAVQTAQHGGNWVFDGKESA